MKDDPPTTSFENNAGNSIQSNDTNQIDATTSTHHTLENVNIFERLPSQVAIVPNQLPVAPVFMKIRLKETDDMLLYENNSYTVLCDSDEANTIENHNELIVGKEKHRTMNDNETQTINAHYKTRGVNTDHIETTTTKTFVSNYDMHDTYEDLETKTERIEIDLDDDRHEQLNVTTYSRHSFDDEFCNQIAASKSFQLSSMIVQRVLAGNVFCENQRRFRNMNEMKLCEPFIQYLYRIRLLYKYRCHETSGSSVSCMSWCPKNTDILAIGYGVFKCEPCSEQKQSAVCLWNIKVS